MKSVSSNETPLIVLTGNKGSAHADSKCDHLPAAIWLHVRTVACRLKLPRAPCWYTEYRKGNKTGVQWHLVA